MFALYYRCPWQSHRDVRELDQRATLDAFSVYGDALAALTDLQGSDGFKTVDLEVWDLETMAPARIDFERTDHRQRRALYDAQQSAQPKPFDGPLYTGRISQPAQLTIDGASQFALDL